MLMFESLKKLTASLPAKEALNSDEKVPKLLKSYQLTSVLIKL